MAIPKLDPCNPILQPSFIFPRRRRVDSLAMYAYSFWKVPDIVAGIEYEDLVEEKFGNRSQDILFGLALRVVLSHAYLPAKDAESE